MVAVPLAPGTLRTEMNDEPSVPTAEEWVDDALPCILRLAAQPELSGASLSVSGYYSQAYLESFIIPDGQPLLAEPKGDERYRSAETRWRRVQSSAPLLLALVAAGFTLAGLLIRRGARHT